MLQAFGEYAETWLARVATDLDGTPPQHGIDVHRNEKWMYAVALRTSGFLRYRLGTDGNPRRFDLSKEVTPQGFTYLEVHEVVSDAEAGFVSQMFDTTARAVEGTLPAVARSLRNAAAHLRARQPLL